MTGGTCSFRVAKVGFLVEDLSVKITQADDIIVHKAEVSHSGACKIEGDGTSQSAHTYNEDTGFP